MPIPKPVATLGSASSHGGVIIPGPGVDPTMLVNGKPIALDGCLHYCPQFDGPIPHGIRPVKAISRTLWKNGRRVVTIGAIAACGAIITMGEWNVLVD